jgi:hypothetical protein
MYEYGGVYADLDVESLKPLDDLLAKYQCILAQENVEHQLLLYANLTSKFTMPAFMACRPHHPFFKLLIDKLSEYITLAWKLPWNQNILKSTGPMFVSEVLDLYVKLYNNTAEDYIHLAPADWFTHLPIWGRGRTLFKTEMWSWSRWNVDKFTMLLFCIKCAIPVNLWPRISAKN